MKLCKIWITQCKAARGIEYEFGTQKALAYLIGEKFMNFLETAEFDPEFQAEIPRFVIGIKMIFEQWQLAEYLETPQRTSSFDLRLYNEDDDPEESDMDRWAAIRRSLKDVLVAKRAKEWLLEDSNA